MSDASETQWMTVSVRLAPDMADVLANFCHERGARGVVIDDEDPESTVITAYFPIGEWQDIHEELTGYLSRLRDLFTGVPDPIVDIYPLKQENWAVAWRDNFRPIRIGQSLLVIPPWIEPEPEGRSVIVIDPAEAFGTGTHETTQGCLELLERAFAELSGDPRAITVLDVGCGSGILAIAAKKLGAASVLGVDNDPVAVESAIRNAELSRPAEEVGFETADLEDLTGPRDIVTANLDSMTLLRTRDKLVSLSDRFLIISGVTADRWDDVKESFLEAGLDLVEEILKFEWGAGLFRAVAGDRMKPL